MLPLPAITLVSAEGPGPPPPAQHVTLAEWGQLFGFRVTWGLILGFFGIVYMVWL